MSLPAALESRLRSLRIVPVLAIDRAEDIVPLCEALGEGGLPVVEITFRTDAGRKALALAASRFPDFLLGAGTVTRPAEVDAAAEAGAAFAVAPGTNPSIIERAAAIGLPFCPGVCTPTDIEAALEAGASTLKFFPAEAAGGLAMLRALHAPYKPRGVSFIPTGGINPSNAGAYLAHPGVVAIGGTWITTADLVAARDWARIKALAREAAAIA